jgi:hypothetical protein
MQKGQVHSTLIALVSVIIIGMSLIGYFQPKKSIRRTKVAS